MLAECGDQILLFRQSLQQPHIAVNSDLQGENATREEHRRDERNDRQQTGNVRRQPFGSALTRRFRSNSLSHLLMALSLYCGWVAGIRIVENRADECNHTIE